MADRTDQWAAALPVVVRCPLCGSAEAHAQDPAAKNLYSEMLAGLVGVDEDELVREVRNVSCAACGLVYKSRWFTAAALQRLFTELVPSHPKGWDVLSGRFTPENVRREVDAYAAALASADVAGQRRYQRSLSSILDSIPALAEGNLGAGIRHAISTGDLPTLRAALPIFERTMDEPAAYKRFSGFSASQLWEYLEAEVGPVDHYAEVGCPLWGLLPRAARAGRLATYVARPEANYWSTGCRQGGLHCVERLCTVPGVAVAPWAAVPERPYAVLGAFQYLDHLEDPRGFLVDALKRANAVALILDDVEGGLAIQHFTGWTPAAIAWLARAAGARVHADFSHIRQSGNVLHLVSRVSR